MNSTYYKNKIEELQKSKSSIQGLSSHINEVETDVAKSDKYMENLTICGERLDKGKIKNINTTLENIKSDFEKIIKECDIKIAEYQEKYEAALLAEEEARRKAALNQNTESKIN